MDEREITDELLATVTKKYADTIQEIEAKKFAYNMGDKKCFEPKENTFCKYCEYMSIKHKPSNTYKQLAKKIIEEIKSKVPQQ